VGCVKAPGEVQLIEQRPSAAGREARPGKLERLIVHLKEVQRSQFTGYIKINITQGHIGRVEKFEEILKS
jgi:hypothetical protein